ncbi:uncharacterized protein K444DRAFT_103978 [Hyaloscypha bicolor E]|uniref:Uncharacterized protein n=1 Tax=Hyaloscypha bicolor E TaxID=1095630 RepID=A0A2J6SX90_9HELO|nr:uncharacterized protein K444DRAFT_103978 [Hyaloscypha bicolor E]PMD55361.1 hypothetical protein K444DRAFT_103978 [Hyaloscypha bicolor E]
MPPKDDMLVKPVIPKSCRVRYRRCIWGECMWSGAMDQWWSGCIWNGCTWNGCIWVWMQIDVARILAAPSQSLHCGATSVCISRGFGHYDFPCDYSCIC